jgi:hypothetical protein
VIAPPPFVLAGVDGVCGEPRVVIEVVGVQITV